MPPWLLPAPSKIALRFVRTQDLLYHTGLTLLEAGAGFAIAAVLGVTLSAGIANSRFLERGLFPYVIVSNAVPIIAIVRVPLGARCRAAMAEVAAVRSAVSSVISVSSTG